MPKELVERYTNEHNKIMDGLKELGLYSLIEKFNLNEKINIVMDYVIRNEKANLEFDLDLLKEVINDYIEILNEEKAKK